MACGRCLEGICTGCSSGTSGKIYNSSNQSNMYNPEEDEKKRYDTTYGEKF